MKYLKSLRHTLLSITLAVILSVLGGWFIFGGGTTETQTASAGSTDNLSGWMWSSNIGWISFNCTNSGENCGTSNYGVHINESQRFISEGTGDFSGSAWSFNIGWISFDRSKTGNPPSNDIGSGSGPIAQIDWTTGNVSGWARALSGCQDIPGVPVSSCSSTAAGAASGGWDGWIKLGSTSGEPNYGVVLNPLTNMFSGYAWGSDVVGWVDSNLQNCGSCGVKFNPIGTPPPVGCGTANGVPTATKPITNLCSDGSAPSVANNNTTPPYSWSWTCPLVSGSASCSAPYTQCSDGIDNDGDGQIDGADSGCLNSSGSYDSTRNSERSFKFKE
ncbi:MAG: hypothetical protein HZB09_02875, partial [Candidatus Yonathbacteria bacterium]|nr:hypothetical protein [Candidatus Yonathbacteria bacterium]